MDTFYPKFGEVELVLVEDNNDFFDPLESNYECEDDNEDVKLQLNDNVYEENQFQLDIDDLSSESADELCQPQNVAVKQEISKQNNDHVNNFKSNLKFENHCEISDESVDADEAYFQDNDSNYSLEIISDDVKPNVKGILEVKKVEGNCEANRLENKSADSENTEKKTVPEVEEKPANTKLESEDKVKATTSKTVTKNGKNKIRNVSTAKRKRIDKRRVDNGRSIRYYSKRNEIPKQAVHNEAYDKKLLHCKICSIQFDRSPAFTEHMRTKHSVDKPFECYICSKAYRISSLLAEHIRYHFGEKPYVCKFCDRSFSQLQPYKAHVRKSHTLERPYKCNFVDETDVKCEETFFDTKTYKFHLREHTNDQPFTCEFCAKKFNHSGTYQAHMRIHTNERPYQCVICGKSFAQISTHKAHMLTHSDEFKFPCTECDKKFKQATNLKLHMRVHTKETPYKCEDCGRGFAQLVTYRNHRRIHTGEKPFVCTYSECGKCFRHRNSFRRHLQTHTGEKPFECKICFKRLSQTSSYVSHMRRHEKPEKS